MRARAAAALFLFSGSNSSLSGVIFAINTAFLSFIQKKSAHRSGIEGFCCLSQAAQAATVTTSNWCPESKQSGSLWQDHGYRKETKCAAYLCLHCSHSP